jgi:hypothetical protein
MSSESDHPSSQESREIVARGNEWFVIGPDGGQLAGPFTTLRQVEDYLDSSDARAAAKNGKSAPTPPAAVSLVMPERRPA